MGRAPCCDKANVKKGPWSPEEDAKLKDFITKYGTAGNWIALPQKAGLKRCGKSCRLRWLNYLRPNIKHGEFSDEEDRIICSLYANIGSRWSIIAAQLPGRTDNDIKNYWNTKLKKKLVGNLIQSSNQPKSLAPFSFQQSQTTLSTLTHLYNSLYYPQPATKTIDPISTTPQTFLQFNTTPPLTTPTTSQIYPHEGLMDFQYCPMRENMLMFGGSEPSCSSSDGSYSKDHTKQEDTRCYYNNQGLMKFVIDDPYNVVLDQQSGKGIDDDNNQLQYDVEQLITGNGSCNNMNMNSLLLMSDEQKRGDTEVYYY